MHVVLDLGLWCISAQETRGPCGPLMGMELSNQGGMLKGTLSERIPLRCSTRNSKHSVKSYKHLQCCQKNKKTKHSCVLQKACVYGVRMHAEMQHLFWLYIKWWHASFLGALSLSEGPGLLRLSFVKEPRGPGRGWLEHTWQFEPLGLSAGITPNWFWRLAVSLRLEMVCCCALCIGWGFGSPGGRKGFFRNQWGGW